MLGIPEVWFPPNSLWYWACNHLVRYALLGALGGAVVGGIQSFAFWQYPRIARWWIVMHALVWAGLLLFSIFFDSLLPGEGGCYY